MKFLEQLILIESNARASIIADESDEKSTRMGI